ncbi:hypothetical protein DL96DRAFT_1611258 [Flagelloscypha sp. PMI_526]|nr:hypothetical protein DL96DRAFT_1611258 [Flagelloscypha sp. PMI_526]
MSNCSNYINHSLANLVQHFVLALAPMVWLRSPKSPKRGHLPPEIWAYIASFLSRDEILRLRDVNDGFRVAVLGLQHSDLDLSYPGDHPRDKAQQIWNSRLDAFKKQEQSSEGLKNIQNLYITPDIEYSDPKDWGLKYNMSSTVKQVFSKTSTKKRESLKPGTIEWKSHRLQSVETIKGRIVSTIQGLSDLRRLHIVEGKSDHVDSWLAGTGLHRPLPSGKYFDIVWTRFAANLVRLSLNLTFTSSIPNSTWFPTHTIVFPNLQIFELASAFLGFPPELQNLLRGSPRLAQITIQRQNNIPNVLFPSNLTIEPLFPYLKILEFPCEMDLEQNHSRTPQNVLPFLERHAETLEVAHLPVCSPQILQKLDWNKVYSLAFYDAGGQWSTFRTLLYKTGAVAGAPALQSLDLSVSVIQERRNGVELPELFKALAVGTPALHTLTLVLYELNLRTFLDAAKELQTLRTLSIRATHWILISEKTFLFRSDGHTLAIVYSPRKERHDRQVLMHRGEMARRFRTKAQKLIQSHSAVLSRWKVQDVTVQLGQVSRWSYNDSSPVRVVWDVMTLLAEVAPSIQSFCGNGHKKVDLKKGLLDFTYIKEGNEHPDIELVQRVRSGKVSLPLP